MQQTSPTPTTRYDWESMLTESDYATMLFIQELMHKGEYQAAKEGIDQLVDFETRVEKREMKQALVRLMTAVILWKEDETYRTSEQVHEIAEARDEVDFYKEEGTELNNGFLEEVWDEAFVRASKYVSIELQQETTIRELTWDAVFTEEYSMFTNKSGYDG